MEKKKRNSYNAKSFELLQRREIAVGLRKQGLPYKEIVKLLPQVYKQKYGRELGYEYTMRMCWNDVKTYYNKASDAIVEDLKMMLLLELERLDELYFAVHGNATSGHLGAIDRALKIMERRAKLLGLDSVSINLTEKPNERIIISFKGLEDEDQSDKD